MSSEYSVCIFGPELEKAAARGLSWGHLGGRVPPPHHGLLSRTQGEMPGRGGRVLRCPDALLRRTPAPCPGSQLRSQVKLPVQGCGFLQSVRFSLFHRPRPHTGSSGAGCSCTPAWRAAPASSRRRVSASPRAPTSDLTCTLQLSYFSPPFQADFPERLLRGCVR